MADVYPEYINTNIEQGYDAILLDPAKSGLMCSECDLVLRDAVQTMEGNRLCLPCFKKIEKSPGYKSSKTGISILDENGKPGWYPDKAVRREVMQLKVKCHNCTFGCPWTGHLLQYFEAHHPGCKYKPISCPNEGCKEMILPVDLKKHQTSECMHRIISCQYCNKATKPVELKGHHEVVCIKLPVKCSHCDSLIPRDEMDDHNLKDCPKVQCNCGQVLHRDAPATSKDSIEAHLSNPAEIFFHIVSLFAVIEKLSKSFSSFEQRLAVIEKTGVTLSKDSSYIKEVSQIRGDVQISLAELSSRIEPLEKYQVDVALTSKDKNMATKVSELQRKLKHLEEKNTQQSVQIHSLQTQIQQRAVSSSLNIEHTGNIDTSRLVTVEKRYEDLEKQVSLLKVHISELELQLQASLASTHNGSFLWRIPDILRRRRDAIEERITSIYSPPFYTGRNGYKMCIRAYLNGDGMGYKTHLSLFFVVMKGEFDALLKWPFDYKVSLILVDQNHRKHIVQTFKPTPESNSFQRPVSDMNVASGCPQFSKLSVLDDTSYVKDDVLFVKCIVDTTRIFHP